MGINVEDEITCNYRVIDHIIEALIIYEHD